MRSVLLWELLPNFVSAKIQVKNECSVNIMEIFLQPLLNYHNQGEEFGKNYTYFIIYYWTFYFGFLKIKTQHMEWRKKKSLEYLLLV